MLRNTTVQQYAALRTVVHIAKRDAENYGKRVVSPAALQQEEALRHMDSAQVEGVYQKLFQKFLEQRFEKLSTDEQNLLHAWNKYLTIT